MPYNLGSSSPSAEDISHEINLFVGETRGKLDTALTELSTLANRVYGYSHDAKVAKDLEAIYDEIIAENPELSELSAVGFTALLKDGDAIPAQGNICYINGTQEETDYVFSGENSEDGTEFVSVWYFENDGVITVNGIDAELLDIIVKQKTTVPAFSTDFFDFAKSVEYSNLPTKPVAVRKQKCTKGGNISDINISATCAEYENYCSTFENYEQLRNGTNFKVVKFPFLTTIAQAASGSYSFLNGCTNLKKIEFPQLVSIGGATSKTTASFHSVPFIVLPETVKEIGNYVFDNNESIILLCKDAESISVNWCASTPQNLFSMCADWGASINIAVAAANWGDEETVDMLLKLRTFTDGGTHRIVTHSRMADFIQTTACTVEEFEGTWEDYMNAKGWEILIHA